MIIKNQSVVLGTGTLAQGPVKSQSVRDLAQVELPVGDVRWNVDTFGHRQAQNQRSVGTSEVVAAGAEARRTVSQPTHLQKETLESSWMTDETITQKM